MTEEKNRENDKEVDNDKADSKSKNLINSSEELILG